MQTAKRIIVKKFVALIMGWIFLFYSISFADERNTSMICYLRINLLTEKDRHDLLKKFKISASCNVPDACMQKLYMILDKPVKGEPIDISIARQRLTDGLQVNLGSRVFALRRKGEIIIRTQNLDATVIGSAMFDLVVPIGDNPFPDWPAKEDLVFANDTQIEEAMKKLPVEITNKVKPTPGGPGQAEAIVLAILGAKTKMIASIGDDEYADELINKMKASGVDTSGIRKVKGRPTAKTYIPSGFAIIDGKKKDVTAFAHAMGADDELDISYLTEDDYKVEVFHIGGVALTPRFMRGGLVKALHRAKEEGAVTVMDTVVDKLYIWKELESSGEAEEICKNLDVLTISRKEREQYTDLKDPAEIVNYFLNKGVKTVIYKMGKEGSVVGSRNSPIFSDIEPVQMPVYNKAGYTVLDGTGMGDAFSAGVSSGILRGYTLGETVAFATAVASLAGQEIGGGNIGYKGEKGAIERKMELEKQADVLSAVTKINSSSYVEDGDGIVDIDEYLVEIEDENSGATWELKALYEEDRELRRERMRTLLRKFKELYPNVKSVVIARAPGRVTGNEHTDYNDATSVGMATRQDHIVVVGLNPDKNKIVFNNMEPDKFHKGEINVSDIENFYIQPAQRKADVPWTTFSIAIFKRLIPRLKYHEKGLQGICMLIDGREEYGGVPIESNIASSAAFEEAQIYAIEAILGIRNKLTSGEVIEIGRESEAALGFHCGKLDQGCSTAGRVEAMPFDRVGAAIDCVPRVDEKGRDKTIITDFTIPSILEGILLNTGEKGQTQREYNIRVIEGELGAWLLNRAFQDFLTQTGQKVDIEKVKKEFGDINIDHNGRPYLYDNTRLYPIFLKPGFYASTVLNKVGVNVNAEQVEEWVKSHLSTSVTKEELVQKYRQEFLDFYVKSALSFHYSLAVAVLKEHNIEVEADKKVTSDILRGWVEALLRGELDNKSDEMKQKDVEGTWFNEIEVTKYNLQGTVLHAIGDQDRSEAIMQALNEAATQTGEEQMAALKRFGELQRQGYESLRYNYRNSTPIIDSVVDWASKKEWCLVSGSCRHFGAGWGGWMEIWIKPGMYNEGYNDLSKWLEGQTWYQGIAKKNVRALKDEHARSIMPYKPGAPASVMGRYRLVLTTGKNTDPNRLMMSMNDSETCL